MNSQLVFISHFADFVQSKGAFSSNEMPFAGLFRSRGLYRNNDSRHGLNNFAEKFAYGRYKQKFGITKYAQLNRWSKSYDDAESRPEQVRDELISRTSNTDTSAYGASFKSIIKPWFKNKKRYLNGFKKKNCSIDAIDDHLFADIPLILKPGIKQSIGTVEVLLANDKGSNLEFSSFEGFQIVETDNYTLENVDGELFLTVNDGFEGGPISFNYTVRGNGFFKNKKDTATVTLKNIEVEEVDDPSPPITDDLADNDKITVDFFDVDSVTRADLSGEGIDLITGETFNVFVGGIIESKGFQFYGTGVPESGLSADQVGRFDYFPDNPDIDGPLRMSDIDPSQSVAAESNEFAHSIRSIDGDLFVLQQLSFKEPFFNPTDATVKLEIRGIADGEVVEKSVFTPGNAVSTDFLMPVEGYQLSITSDSFSQDSPFESLRFNSFTFEST